ncbi:MAG: protease inhibitor I42 family protein [Methanoregula sp.]
MNHTIIIVCLGMICLIAVVFSGCIGSGPGNHVSLPTLTETPVQVGHQVVNETQNTATVYMNQSNSITVKLAENPLTGFQWNLTTTAGLRIIKDEYIPTDTSGKLVGSGGTHIWDISTDMIGKQEIHAIYKRSWEPITGNESTFSMIIMVS